MLERARETLSATPSELQETVSSEKKMSVSFSSAETAVAKALILVRGRWWNREVSDEKEGGDDKLKGKRMNLGDENDVNLQKLRIGMER